MTEAHSSSDPNYFQCTAVLEFQHQNLSIARVEAARVYRRKDCATPCGLYNAVSHTRPFLLLLFKHQRLSFVKCIAWLHGRSSWIPFYCRRNTDRNTTTCFGREAFTVT